jgi:hypothetical protein
MAKNAKPPRAMATAAARKAVQLAGSNLSVNSHLPFPKQVQHGRNTVPEIIVRLVRLHGAITLRRGVRVRRIAYLAVLSVAQGEADKIAAQRGWRRAR